MPATLVYLTYAAAALAAGAIFVGLPKDGRPMRRGLFVVIMAAGLGAMFMLLQQLYTESGQLAAFMIWAVLSLGCAVRVVTHPKPVYSAVYFVTVVLATAALCIQAGAEFLGFALIIVYAGAILVTYAFVIMLSQQPESAGGPLADLLDFDRNAREPVWSVLAGFALMATVGGTIASRSWTAWSDRAADPADQNVLRLGRLLMTDYAVAVELAAVLLTVAMVGAIAVARRRLASLEEGREPYTPGQAGREVKPF